MNPITTTPTSKLPLYFRLKKYLLMGLIFATIAIYIFFILNFASKMNKGEEGSSSAGGAHNKPPTGEQAFKPLTNTYNVSRTALIVLIVIFAFFILFQLLGTIGTLREYFCITCTYVILQFAISVVNFILITFYGSTLWGAASWSLLVLVFGLIYLRDLYLIHIGEEKQQVEQQTRRSSSLQIGSSGGGGEGRGGDGTAVVVGRCGDPEIGF